MCVGKTTIGREIAKQTNRRFYDLDWYIEERFRKRVSQIFAEDGEAYFRDLERRMLHEVAEFEDIVLSLGGGTPCFFDNMAYLNTVGTTVYLQAQPDTILTHLSMARGKRPLLEGKQGDELREYVCNQLAEREPYYQQAQFIHQVDVLRDGSKVKELAAALIEQCCGQR